MSVDTLLQQKGKYRIKANYDLRTNDYPRDEGGNITNKNDIFIYCGSIGDEIYHYGGHKYRAYITSSQRGRRFLKELGDKAWMINDGTFETVFEFRKEHIDDVAKLLGALTGGANMSPFSTKNLPKNKYTIPQNDIDDLKDIFSAKFNMNFKDIPLRDVLNVYGDYYTRYKKKSKSKKGVKVDAREAHLKPKELIHSLGLWEDLKKYVKSYKI